VKTIVAGSRDIVDIKPIRIAFKRCSWEITEVVSGTARGVDRMGEQVAEELGIPVKRFPADWDKFKKAAGHIRNAEMAKYADALIAIWDGESPGTANMIAQMRKLGKRVFVRTSRKV
jgi:hypothetical protein